MFTCLIGDEAPQMAKLYSKTLRISPMTRSTTHTPIIREKVHKKRGILKEIARST